MTESQPLKCLGQAPMIVLNRNTDRKAKKRWLETYLRGLGLDVEFRPDGPITLVPHSVILMNGNAVWFPKVCRQLKACPADARPLVVHWFSEPLPPPVAANLPRPRLNFREIIKILVRDKRITDPYSNSARLKSLARAAVLDLLVVTSLSRKDYLEEQRVQAAFIPYGYNKNSQGEFLGLERTRDTIFLGQIVPRRRKLIGQLEKSGIQVDKMGDWFDPRCWGENRTRTLNQTRIFLNLGRHPGEAPSSRFCLGIASKCLVVSEPVYRPDPFVAGKHFVACSMEEMPDVIRHYLDHPEEREEIVEAGYRLITETVTLENSVMKLLELIERKLSDKNRKSWGQSQAPE